MARKKEKNHCSAAGATILNPSSTPQWYAGIQNKEKFISSLFQVFSYPSVFQACRVWPFTRTGHDLYRYPPPRPPPPLLQINNIVIIWAGCVLLLVRPSIRVLVERQQATLRTKNYRGTYKRSGYQLRTTINTAATNEYIRRPPRPPPPLPLQ